MIGRIGEFVLPGNTKNMYGFETVNPGSISLRRTGVLDLCKIDSYDAYILRDTVRTNLAGQSPYQAVAGAVTITDRI